MGMMSQKEFDRRVQRSRMAVNGKTVQAAKLVLVKGKSRTEASREIEITLGVVSRGVKAIKAVKLECVICPKCKTKFEI